MANPLLALNDAVVVREQAGVVFQLNITRFQLDRGQCIGLLGASGCGKSTLLDLLDLIIRPQRCTRFQLFCGAETEIDVKHLWDSDNEQTLAALRRDYFGYVLQTGGLLPFLSVAANITLPAQIAGKTLPREYLQQQAARMGIAGVLAKKPQYLSGGQRQRAAILRALINRPQLVLADEPTAAVDSARAQSILNDFKTMARQSDTAIVIATHDQSVITALADSVYGFEVSENAGIIRSYCSRLTRWG